MGAPVSVDEANPVQSVMAAIRTTHRLRRRGRLPDRPREAGNPVFSVYQTDNIYYGRDLFNYFCNEFSYYFGRAGYVFDDRVRHIDFWSDLTG